MSDKISILVLALANFDPQEFKFISKASNREEKIDIWVKGDIAVWENNGTWYKAYSDYTGLDYLDGYPTDRPVQYMEELEK